ncbi:MAG: prepilin-type N-terminal cleavage/methylation domain-containing protein, partial [Acidobacteriia bacterium]|nr:prepilin-type N-terminal cleavage/methylation domain-containing protein [Terriglobia bacterium]
MQLERSRKVLAPRGHRQGGFTLIEMLIAMMILLAVAGIVMSGMVQMMFVQGSVANRSEMHSSVRSATELLQQEIGQAGRATLPAPVTMSTPVVIPPGTQGTGVTQTVSVSSTTGMFNGEYLVVDTGADQETVQISGLTPTTFTATFYYSHPTVVGATSWPVTVQGAFITGIVPPDKVNTSVAGLPLVPNTNASGVLVGSTGTKLKLYGDINGDGNMVYIEYTCDTSIVPGNLYRNVIPVPAEGVTI